tara:strand:+ start:24912 stop:25310 length:399 start_codon:yes stop_codon:yes gene_type:complete
MSELSSVILVSEEWRKPKQKHKRLKVWYNIYESPSYPSEIYSNEDCDIFGFIPRGFNFAHENVITNLVNLFNTNPTKIALVLPNIQEAETPYFINKRVIPNDFVIKNLDSLLNLIMELDLIALQIEESVFIK